MSDFEFGIDIDKVTSPDDFVRGVLWMGRAIHEVNTKIRKDMYAFDGSERAEGIRLTIEKQNEALEAVEGFVRTVFGEA